MPPASPRRTQQKLSPQDVPAEDTETAGMVFIRGGTFVMGSERHQPEGRFTHIVRVDGFWIDRHEVTNAQFQKFVEATGYVTLAERGLDPKTHAGMAKQMLVPGSVVFIQPTEARRGGSIAQWWQYVPGANWRQPTGPGSSIVGKGQSSGRAYRLRGRACLCALARA